MKKNDLLLDPTLLKIFGKQTKYGTMLGSYLNPFFKWNVVHIIHISHGFEGDIPEYQPRGDTKALARYVTRCRRQRVTYRARAFVSPRG